MHTLDVLCIGWVLGIQVTCLVLVNLYVQVFIPSVNEHCDHYLVVITWLIKPWFETSLHPCLITLSLFHMHFILFCIQWSWCIVVFSGISCSYDSSASQLLELIVNEFCLTVPNSHIKSRVCFRVLSRNSQRGRL